MPNEPSGVPRNVHKVADTRDVIVEIRHVHVSVLVHLYDTKCGEVESTPS